MDNNEEIHRVSSILELLSSPFYYISFTKLRDKRDNDGRR